MSEPWPPPPGRYPYPTAGGPQAKRRASPLWIGVGLLVLVVTAGGTWLAVREAAKSRLPPREKSVRQKCNSAFRQGLADNPDSPDILAALAPSASPARLNGGMATATFAPTAPRAPGTASNRANSAP